MYRHFRRIRLEEKLDENFKEVEKHSEEIAKHLDKICDLEIDLQEYEK